MSPNVDFLSKRKLEDVGRWYINGFVRRAAAAIPAGSRVLDAGAGEGAYRELFGHCRYEAADLGVGDATWNYSDLNAVSHLERLPFRTGVFDAILCTQVLEHVEWPRESVRELHRVLRPGGTLYMTVPMAHPEHQAPYDFFRYTSWGIRSILERTGFHGLEIEPFGGLPARLAYELPRLLRLLPASGLVSGNLDWRGVLLLPLRLVLKAAIACFQILLLAADRFDRTRDDPFGWAVIARK